MTVRLLFLEDFFGFIRNLSQVLDAGGERLFWWVGGTFFIETRRHRSWVQEFWHWLHWADSFDFVETSLSGFGWCVLGLLATYICLSVDFCKFNHTIQLFRSSAIFLWHLGPANHMLHTSVEPISITVDETLSRWSHETIKKIFFRRKATTTIEFVSLVTVVKWNK